MDELDLKNPEQRKAIQEVLRQGSQSQFWKLVCQRLREHIDSVQRQLDSSALASLPADEYKTLTEKLKSEKMDRIGIIDMPEVLVKEMDNPEFFGEDKEEEIYDTAEDFKRKK